MERIAKLADMIREEVCDATKYAKLALQTKDIGEAADARTFADIANQELGHADRLHAMVVSAIETVKREGREVPAGMERVWDFEHARIIDETAAARSLLQMLNG